MSPMDPTKTAFSGHGFRSGDPRLQTLTILTSPRTRPKGLFQSAEEGQQAYATLVNQRLAGSIEC